MAKVLSQIRSNVPLYKNLGGHTRKITTSSPEAQRYFDQGLTLTYAFNHEEATRMFKEATRLDPNCAICYWGIAYVLGPNYNAAMDNAVVPDAYAAIQKADALAHAGKATEMEHAQHPFPVCGVRHGRQQHHGD